MRYFVSDGCTFEYYVTNPFEYESIEKAEFDFLELCEFNKTQRYDPFNFAGHYFDYSNFYYTKNVFKGDNEEFYNGPEILTLEDWFEKYKGKI